MIEPWMDPVYDASGMGEADRWAIEQAGIPSLDLMESAGRGLARAVAELARGSKVTIVCGKGNNGGDGLVAARHLIASGFEVGVILLGEPSELSPDSASNLNQLPQNLIEVSDGGFGPTVLEGIVVDAMLGTGFEGAPREPVASVIHAINQAEATVVACDVPSGVNASTGEANGPAVRADRTVTFHRRKLGHLINPGKGLCGVVEVAPIGIPEGAPGPEAGGSIRPEVLGLLPRRGAKSNKFTSGRVSIVGGSRGLTGAVCLAADSSIRSGVGYATAAVPGGLESIFELKLTEVMTRGIGSENDRLEAEQVDEVLEHLEGAASVVLGSGAGRGDQTADLVRAVAAKCQAPLVLDADGLSTFGTDLQPIANRGAPTVLTPHEGEASRLLDVESSAIAAQRLGSALRLARETSAVVLLKGDDTIITDGDRVAINSLPSPALATAGTGDVLAGIVGAFIARGLAAFEAAAAAVFTHAMAGQIAAIRVGNQDGVIASDVIEAIPQAMKASSA